MQIDLDAAKAARLEKSGEPHSFVYGGETYELPVELPARFAFYLAHGDTDKALEFLLGTETFEAFIDRHRASVQDFQELCTAIAKLYAFSDVGESAASGGSSSNGGNHLRPTSSGSTGSTSPKPAGAKRKSGPDASAL